MGNIRKYQKVHRDAVAAADKAYDAVNAGQYVAVQHENPLNDNSPIVKVWEQPFELEGFGWVVMPGNTGFGRWLVKNGKASKHYGGGVGPRAKGRGYERRMAWAQGYANVVNASGILPPDKKAYAEGRLD
jgi:hypothetical protein